MNRKLQLPVLLDPTIARVEALAGVCGEAIVCLSVVPFLLTFIAVDCVTTLKVLALQHGFTQC